MMRYLINGKNASKEDYDTYQDLSLKYWSGKIEMGTGTSGYTDKISQLNELKNQLRSADVLQDKSTLRARKRRNRIAEGFAFALAQHENFVIPPWVSGDLCREAVKLADALIEELDKPK